MNTVTQVNQYQERVVLNPASVRGLLYTTLLLVSAALLPAVAHLTGAPVRILLPMHWPVILAGLVFGYRGGAAVGLLAPIVSYIFSGMPYPPMVLPMTIELFSYGFLAGILVEKSKINSYLAVFIALILGRMFFLTTVVLLGSYSGQILLYAKAALVPGVAAGLLQMAILPFVARAWIKKELLKGDLDGNE